MPWTVQDMHKLFLVLKQFLSEVATAPTKCKLSCISNADQPEPPKVPPSTAFK